MADQFRPTYTDAFLQAIKKRHVPEDVLTNRPWWEINAKNPYQAGLDASVLAQDTRENYPGYGGVEPECPEGYVWNATANACIPVDAQPAPQQQQDMDDDNEPLPESSYSVGKNTGSYIDPKTGKIVKGIPPIGITGMIANTLYQAGAGNVPVQTTTFGNMAGSPTKQGIFESIFSGPEETSGYGGQFAYLDEDQIDTIAAGGDDVAPGFFVGQDDHAITTGLIDTDGDGQNDTFVVPEEYESQSAASAPVNAHDLDNITWGGQNFGNDIDAAIEAKNQHDRNAPSGGGRTDEHGNVHHGGGRGVTFKDQDPNTPGTQIAQSQPQSDDNDSGGGGGGGGGCVIATYGTQVGGFTADEKRSAIEFCKATLHDKWWGEAFRRGYRYAGRKVIASGDANKYFNEFKNFVAVGRGEKTGILPKLKMAARFVHLFVLGITVARNEK